MNYYFRFGLLLLSCFFIIGCAANRYAYHNTQFTKETWVRWIDQDPSAWTKGADSWFLNGSANETEIAARQAPYSAAISTLSVNVPDFSRVRIEGDFQVQLFGTEEKNTVYVFGENERVRNIAVEVHGDTLCVTQTGGTPYDMHHAIVRIGVKQLSSLEYLGDGTVEGIRLQSPSLSVSTAGSGNVYLGGYLNLTHVTHLGSGTLNVFGAHTPALAIFSKGSGCVNVSGDIGIRSIEHHDTGDVNLIGANSRALNIVADGAGKIGIKGVINLQKVNLSGKVGVYAYTVKSKQMSVDLSQQARLGLAGKVGNLFLNTRHTSSFEGRDLLAQNAYVRAMDHSNINLSASCQVFIAAHQDGRVYFFGPASTLSSYIGERANIIPIKFYTMNTCMVTVPAKKSRYLK